MTAKRTFTFIAALVLLSAVPVLSGTTLPDVVAVVNGDKITKDQLTSVLIDWQAPIVLDRLIAMRIIGQEARKAGINVTEAQIRAGLEERMKGRPPGQSVNEALKQFGLTPGCAFAIIKMQLQSEGVLRKSFKMKDSEFENYRRLSQIVIRVPYMPSGEESGESKENPKDKEAKEKIEKIAQEIKDGLSFEEAAKEYSEDESSKAKGGDLGFITRSDMLPDLAKVAFELKPGEMSAPVKTVQGYYLIKATALGKDMKDEERKNIEETTFKSKYWELYQDWFLSIKNKAKVVNALEPSKPERKPAERPKPVRRPRPETAPPPPPDTSEPQPGEMPPPPPPEPAQSAPADSAQPAPSETPTSGESAPAQAE